jgi:putative oxidoreductase
MQKSPSPQPKFAAIVSRWLLAALFIVSGIAKALTFTGTAAWLGSESIPAPEVVLALVIALEVAGGLALGAGVATGAVSAVFLAFTAAATVLFHAFWAAPAEQMQDQLTHFMKNVAIAGGLILLWLEARAMVKGPGQGS